MMMEKTILRTDFTESQLDAIIQAACARHGNHRDAIIPILSEINHELGFIPPESYGKIRRVLNAPSEGLFLADSHLHAIASFYHMFLLHPTGMHIVRYCESAPCHVSGGRQMVEALHEHLGIQAGETTPDQRWTILKTSCLGICGVGPVFLVDGDLYGNVTPERVPRILARYR